MLAESLNELDMKSPSKVILSPSTISPLIFGRWGKSDLDPQKWKVFQTISGFLLSGWDHCFMERQRMGSLVTSVWPLVFRLPERLSRRSAFGGNAGSGKGQKSSWTDLFVLLCTSEWRTKQSHCERGGCFTPQSIENICGWWMLVWIIRNK